jgi:hypothetical protein
VSAATATSAPRPGINPSIVEVPSAPLPMGRQADPWTLIHSYATEEQCRSALPVVRRQGYIVQARYKCMEFHINEFNTRWGIWRRVVTSTDLPDVTR